MPLKNPVTPPGIDPGTFQIVAHRLKHYATPRPNTLDLHVQNYKKSISFAVLNFKGNN
jgi:hypothetical protein